MPQMSETELMELARSYDDLQEVAQAALRAEFARRGLEPPLVEEPDELRVPSTSDGKALSGSVEASGRSLLESAGIAAWIADENLVRMDWFYSNAVGGMRLQVDENDEAAAREIIEEEPPRSIAYGEGEVCVQPICPKCGSAEVTMGDRDGARAVTLWRSTSWRYRCHRESRRGIARHVAHSGKSQMINGALRRRPPPKKSSASIAYNYCPLAHYMN